MNPDLVLFLVSLITILSPVAVVLLRRSHVRRTRRPL